MNVVRLLSDHIYDWSDKLRGQIISYAAQATPGVDQEVAAVGCGFARLAHRAIQALRQAWLQVCRGSRPWPQVLPVGELSGTSAANGLRIAGRLADDAHVGRELPPGAQRARGSLLDQPRAATTPRGVVRMGGERSGRTAHRPDRRSRGCTASRKHARGVDRSGVPHARGWADQP